MTHKVIVWTPVSGPDAGIASISFPPYADRAWAGRTEDEILAWSIEHQVGKDAAGATVPHHIIEKADYDRDPFVADRTFRQAWICPSGTLECDMTKARVIHLEEIRKVRNAELVKEDVTFMRAVEAEDTDAQATIKTKKQTLRDIPATFDITTDVDTPEKLKAKWPTELPTRE